MSKKSWPILYSNLLYKFGQEFSGLNIILGYDLWFDRKDASFVPLFSSIGTENRLPAVCTYLKILFVKFVFYLFDNNLFDFFLPFLSKIQNKIY